MRGIFIVVQILGGVIFGYVGFIFSLVQNSSLPLRLLDYPTLVLMGGLLINPIVGGATALTWGLANDLFAPNRWPLFLGLMMIWSGTQFLLRRSLSRYLYWVCLFVLLPLVRILGGAGEFWRWSALLILQTSILSWLNCAFILMLGFLIQGLRKWRYSTFLVRS